jgi:hypothetical protein
VKTKIGTVLDADLVRQARSIATREGKRLNRVLEEALADHVVRKSVGHPTSVVNRTAGWLKLARRHVDRILREEPGILDE